MAGFRRGHHGPEPRSASFDPPCCGGGLDLKAPTSLHRLSSEEELHEEEGRLPEKSFDVVDVEELRGLLEEHNNRSTKDITRILQAQGDELEERIAGRLCEALKEQTRMLKKRMEKLDLRNFQDEAMVAEEEEWGGKAARTASRNEQNEAATASFKHQRRTARTQESMFQVARAGLRRLSIGGGGAPAAAEAKPAAADARQFQATYAEQWAFDDRDSETYKVEKERILQPSRCGRVAASRLFRVGCVALMLTNSVFIVAQTEYAALHPGEPTLPTVMMVVDLVFTLGLSVEVVIRMLAQRGVFACGREVYWNMTDVVLVVLAVQDSFGSLLQANQAGSGYWSVLRVLRILRLVRVFRYSTQLSAMISGFVRAVLSMTWALLLLGFLMVTAGLVFVAATTNFLVDHGTGDDVSVLKSSFGSVPTAVLCLLKAITGGMEWERVGDALFKISSVYGLLLCLYITVVTFGLASMLVALLLDFLSGRARKAKQERLEELVNEMRRALAVLDTETTGYVTKDQFALSLDVQGGRLPEVIKSLDVRKAEARRYFDLLDLWDEQRVSIRTLTRSFLHLGGEPRSQDIVFLLYEHRRLAKNFQSFCNFVDTKFGILFERFGLDSDGQARMKPTSSMSGSRWQSALSAIKATKLQSAEASPSPTQPES